MINGFFDIEYRLEQLSKCGDTLVKLKELKLVEKIFDDFDRYLAESGFEAKKGQIIDASIVAAPKQRNSREENKQIKDGEIPEDWSQKKRSHKDTDANWVQKNGKNYFGYKNHVEVDVKNKKLSNWEKQGNYTRSKNRSRVEHVFGIQAQKAKTLIVRTIGIVSAEVKNGLRNLPIICIG